SDLTRILDSYFNLCYNKSTEKGKRVPPPAARRREEIMTMSNRKFGVEIEFIFSGNIHDVAAKLNEYGVTTVVEGYNHQTRAHWKIVHDASCGWELVSPPMAGEAGLEEIRKACKALVDSGA